jgi:omega-6 fatty acid desaturase (delta-12 desaturase)
MIHPGYNPLDTSPSDHLPSAWRHSIAPYAKPDARRAMIQLLNTGLPFLGIEVGTIGAINHGVTAALLLIPIAAVLLVRLFIIQHDCGHGSFFASRRANDWLGRVLGVLTLTPYEAWRRDHARHHASSGNLDRRGVGDVITLSVKEYRSLPPARRLAYRLYRHPLVIFGIGPTYKFLIRHRIPTGHPLRCREHWCSILGTNAGIAVLTVSGAMTAGLEPFLLAYLPVILLAASIGVWLFYVQHQFEETYWETQSGWNFRAAALKGCSFYDLPRALHWATGHIGFHHIHHLSSRIPNYRLRECYEGHAEFRQVKRLSLWASLGCARLALWDEERHKLVSFGKIRRS